MTKSDVYCIIRYAEIATKGKNRYVFEELLMENIKQFLNKQNIAYLSLKNPRGRILLHLKTFNEDSSYTYDAIIDEYNQIIKRLKYIFGIASYSIAIVIADSIKNIKQTILSYFSAQLKNCATFRISTQRIDKNAIPSIELDKAIGEFVVNTFQKKVNLKHAELDFGIELMDNKAFLFTNKIISYGGLPVGIEGAVIAYIEDKRSILAAVLMLKRGCKVIFFGSKDILDKYRLFLKEIIIYKTEYIYSAQNKQEDKQQILQLSEKYNIPAIVIGAYLPKNNFFEEKIVQLNPISLLTDAEVNEQLDSLIDGV
ncbi:hypothetical protein HZA96_02940 [Candidatus Woesearchaeota archaeon]|nr:hypothetical protein [Candidatus Woesearchaeota archaeon]